MLVFSSLILLFFSRFFFSPAKNSCRTHKQTSLERCLCVCVQAKVQLKLCVFRLCWFSSFVLFFVGACASLYRFFFFSCFSCFKLLFLSLLSFVRYSNHALISIRCSHFQLLQIRRRTPSEFTAAAAATRAKRF